jgi:predicted esterase
MEQFAYQPTAVEPVIRSVQIGRSGTLEDLSFQHSGGGEVEAYLITAAGQQRAVQLFVHMLGGGADRSQFLGEAWKMAESGVSSLLVQGRFPWIDGPTDFERDRDRIRQEIIGLRQGIDLVTARLGSDSGPLAFVGHDYGAMYGALLAQVDSRVTALVSMAGHPHFATWFVKYWDVGASGSTYEADIATLDPVHFLAALRRLPILFQFGTDDEFVSEQDRAEMVAAVPYPVESVVYESDHRLNDQAMNDRCAWLVRALGLEREPRAIAPS